MGRAPCCEIDGVKKGPWTSEEDQKLIDYIHKNGYGNWRTLPKNAGLQRCGKSCRLRWTNYLRPDIKRGRFSFEEEEAIIQLHSILGNKWSAIAARLPGRTDNEIKNYWNTHLRKRLLRMGIDPVSHSPRLDLLDISSLLRSSLYNSSQEKLSRSLGAHEPLVNPEILRLVSSLLSNSQRGNPNFLFQENQISDHDVQTQLPPLILSNNNQSDGNAIQEIPNGTIPCVPFASETQLMEPNVEQFSSDFSNSSSQNCQLNEWKSDGMTCNITEDYGPISNYGYFGSNQSIMDPPPSENSNFHSNNSNSFSFESVLSNLSSPSSSSTRLDSNSTYINSCNICTEDDQIESFCSNMMSNFEMLEMFDVNEFL